MRAHAYDPWSRYEPWCRMCGGREHSDTRPLVMLRDAAIAILLVFCAIVGSVAVFGS